MAVALPIQRQNRENGSASLPVSEARLMTSELQLFKLCNCSATTRTCGPSSRCSQVWCPPTARCGHGIEVIAGSSTYVT